MDDVNAAVEEHREQGRMSKWWNGIAQSKSGQAFGNHSAVKALTYVGAPSPHSSSGPVGASAAGVEGQAGSELICVCCAPQALLMGPEIIPCPVWCMGTC